MQGVPSNLRLDYKSVIRRELQRRRASNPSYSLRAFAKFLNVSPAYLSRVLKGDLGISKAKAVHISQRLGLSAEEHEVFAASIKSVHGRTPGVRTKAKTKLRRHQYSFSALEGDDLRMIGAWEHFALLEFITLRKSRNDTFADMAHALGLKPEVAEEAGERLLRLGLIKKTRKGYLNVRPLGAFPDPLPAAWVDAMRELYRKLIQKAVVAIDEQAIEDRDVAASIFGVERARLPALRAEIKEFRRSLIQNYGVSKRADSIYCFNTQLFDLGRGKIK